MKNHSGFKIASERIEREKHLKSGSLSLCLLGLSEFPESIFELENLRSLSLGNTTSFFDDFAAEPNDVERLLSQLHRLPIKELDLGELDSLDLSSLADHPTLE